ncbi:site-specific integrase [Halodesulfurarchaeum sp. HSR-GB]|uniref:tyrosine-type recombinase/integrase n=1 Tax=Halodesulfurarchaeum sp. HSR-GB TaxID=3074077 RepID=UPI0028673592|nr:site-specific integrase [Halodesulfurarchaeum sp. HSR-GB]MDR5657308.1 site-specific integrase [Halodesulfurarchaeum sp. HSR-GB]
MSRERPSPKELSPKDAIERYLRRRRPDSTDRSIQGWKYRLKLFREWLDEVGIEEVGELRRYDLDEYYEHRSAEIKPVTLEGEMWTLHGFVSFLEDIGAVEDGLADSVRIPDLDPEDRSSDIKLHADAALALLDYYRNNETLYGTRRHAFFELLWHTGARQGGIRGLDLQDVELQDDPTVNFRHRPGSGTPLKNKRAGERPVGISETVADVLRTYVRVHRHKKVDDHQRSPFLTTTRGRPSPQTLRAWSYRVTIPCEHHPCPHSRSRDTCPFVDYHKASQCPSSRSPHQIRTGAITWMLNRGWPPEDVAARVNASVETIEQHYDKADLDQRRKRQRQRMEKRRRPLLDQLQNKEENQ